jgi:hypothetical protein
MYDNTQGKCVDVMEGVNPVVNGMTLSSLKIEPEFWRTNSNSTDIRECPNPLACVGGEKEKHSKFRQ